MRVLAALPWLVFLLACAGSALPLADAGSSVRLGPPDEPGQPLRLTGVLRRVEDGSPIVAGRVRLYQADAGGEYQARVADDERTARLSAELITDGQGRFSVRTTVPGGYGTPPGDPHLHVEVAAADPPAHVVYFNRFLGESTRRWARTTEQAHVVALTVRADGLLVGHLELGVRGVPR